MSDVYNNHDFEENDEYCHLIAAMHTHDLAPHIDQLRQHIENYRESLMQGNQPKGGDYGKNVR